MKPTKPIDLGSGRPPKPKTALPTNGAALTFNDKPGLLTAIQRLRGAEIQAAQDYRLALSTGDPDLGRAKKKDWLDLVESLRRVESSNPDIPKANAQSLPVADVERETGRMVNALSVAFWKPCPEAFRKS